MQPTAPLAPGARVVIRDSEWIVRRVDRSRDGGRQFLGDGVSELVRGREAIFLSALDRVQILDPALQALRQPRRRVLIVDAVGLGRTLRAGILASELIARGRD